MRRRASFSPATIALTCLCGLAPVACGGRLAPSDNSGVPQLALVDPSQLATAPAPCAEGAAHPNACCDADPRGDGQCGEYPGAPFHPCATGWLTYPDPRSCCALADPSQCSAPPAQGVAVRSGTCLYGCPPGSYPTEPITISSGACCSSSGTGVACFGWGVASPTAAGIPAGASDVSFSGSSEPAPLLNSYCDVPCPSGWQAQAMAPDVCCIEGAGADGPCFSIATGSVQGVGAVSSATNGAGSSATGEAPSSSGSGAASSSTASLGTSIACTGPGGDTCSCSAVLGGHVYSLQCSNTSDTCNCIEDDTVTSGIGEGALGASPPPVCPPADGGAGANLAFFWTMECGFPD
ncbi:MAG TPA: hypothetical protein VEK07_25085 [Polyangiaceae bacterium]|nr:hypothetical protein [Polyangiaceae bacterium]